jgi:hypothetical protein
MQNEERQDGELAYFVGRIEQAARAICRELREKTEFGEREKKLADGFARVAERFAAYVRGEAHAGQMIVSLQVCENILADKPLTDAELAQQCADEVQIEDWIKSRGDRPWPEGLLNECVRQFPDLGQDRVRTALQRLSHRDLLPGDAQRLLLAEVIAALNARLARRREPERRTLAGVGASELREALSQANSRLSQALADAFPDSPSSEN